MKTCTNCHRENREQARYCRFCGEELREIQGKVTVSPHQTPASCDCLDELVGLETPKNQIRELATTVKSIVGQRGKAVLNSINMNILITGPSGSGKSRLVFTASDYLRDEGIFGEDEQDTFTALTIDDLNLGEKPIKAITLDDAHKLLPPDENDELTGTPLEYIFENARLRLLSGDDRLVIIMSGSQEFQNYVDKRPELKNLFALNICLPEYSPTEVAQICEAILRDTYGLSLADEAREKLCRVFNYERRNSDKFGNAHLAASKANELMLRASMRSKGKIPTTVTADDVTGREYIPKTLEEVMQEFDKYVGVDEIKNTMVEIVNSIKSFQKLHPDKTYELKDHYLFLGNPGTGKTTMARVFADALSAMGILPSGQLVEVAPKDLKGQYMGHTGPKVDAVFDRAMGGVLFIDEAYDMWGGENDTFGNEAVTALIKNVEDRRGKLIVILAGYPREMGVFATANPGISSRFNTTINFRDYNGAELTEIARRMIKAQGYTLDQSAEKAIDKFFEKMYISRKKDFANAREVRNAVDKAIKTQNTRIQQAMNAPGFDASTEFVLTMADFTGENENPPMSVDEVIATLDDLIGMEEIKKEIRKLANVAMVNRLRMERGLGAAALQPVNIILTGNPGTGKTTIAKRLGQVLHAAGVLATDKVVEREAKTILSSYVNASGQNMDKAVDEAMGGVLFIDEAYNLIPLNTPGTKDKDGVAAVEALMTRMSNDAGKFVTVMAGYKTEMEEFVANANPGLARRFTYRIHIDDYSVDNLVDIFKLNARKEGIRLTPEAEGLLRTKVEEMVTMKDKNFGNAGEMVKLFNAAKERQSTRLCELPPEELTDEQLYTLEAADIPYDPPKKIDLNECMRELDELVGLPAVKKAVRELADTLAIERRRAAADGGKANVNLDHYLFLGNPGTGKTTVARIMGNIFYSLGLLPSNKVVEVTPKDLIAPYVGQTGPKTEQMINRAVGGIFFIDEAYGLNDGAGGFGKDAMPVLLTKLLDYKGKMVSIAAGYPKEMQQWISTNSGLESRFTRKIHFEDYTAEELAEIFRRIVKQHRLRMDEYADEEMQHYFSILVYNKGRNFANAREARNYFDRVKLNQGRRLRKLMDLPGFKEEELYVLRQEDMEINE